MKFDKFLIDKSSDFKTTLEKMSEGSRRILFVTKGEQFLFGVLTDGDIRRWILSTGKMEGQVEEYCNRNPIVFYQDYNLADVKEQMLSRRLDAVPILDSQRKIVDILFWEDVSNEQSPKILKKRLDVPVVIMAGGMGTRLYPFTLVLPKPLIPIGDKPVIEVIMDNFHGNGVTDFYISVNHKSKIIKAYLEDVRYSSNIQYLDEDMPLGTIGSLKLLEGKIDGSFFVTNCDIIINGDYYDIMESHLKNDYDMTIIASVKNFRIPYGICEIINGGELHNMREKPEYNLLVNTGMYVLKSSVLKYIPEKKFFHMTDLVEKMKADNRRIGIFPVSEKSWIDVGEWEQYKQALEKLNP